MAGCTGDWPRPCLTSELRPEICLRNTKYSIFAKEMIIFASISSLVSSMGKVHSADKLDPNESRAHHQTCALRLAKWNTGMVRVGNLSIPPCIYHMSRYSSARNSLISLVIIAVPSFQHGLRYSPAGTSEGDLFASRQ